MRVITNSLIKASAGTGKTFALATRMIRLMLLGVAPDHIVALTFSRAAAGEIFNRLAGRLADASESEEKARQESAHVYRGADGALADALRKQHGDPVPRAVFAGLLRRLIATQHTSMIGTIDSFMTRMVQAFPLELGLQGSLTIMDEYCVAREKESAMTTLLNRAANAPDTAVFFEAFRQATFGKEGKSYSEKLATFVSTWHDALHVHPSPTAWGDPQTIWPPRGIPFHAHGEPALLAQQLTDELRDDWEAVGLGAQWDTFCEFVRTFNTAFSGPAIIKNVLNACPPGATVCEIKSNRKTLSFTGKKAALIIQTVETLYARALRARCETTQGVGRLMEQIENVYAQNTRSHGLLTFDDIPRLIAGLDIAIRQNIEYRFDSRFSHWALDEFQDTSLAQWMAIRNLVDEIIQSTEDERSVFIVGDAKQAIYGWRGGDVAIFEREAESGHYECADLHTTYRYCPQIADLVNRVFDGDRIASRLNAVARGAGARWQRLWLPHVSRQPDGWCGVERVPAPNKEDGENTLTPYLKAACDRFKAIRPWERGLSAAVLVRTNDQGASFAEALRREGIPAVWEGESVVCDTPVVTALLHVLQAAEHPGDTLAWQHLRATPLAKTVFREACALPPEQGAAALSRRVLDDVSRLGLPRALRDYIDAVADTFADDPFTQMRLDELIRAATQFVADADANTLLTDFTAFAEAFKTRDVADTSAVKILTIHRSKGLGFDFVLLPIIEKTGIGSARARDILFAPDGTWLLANPGTQVTQVDDTLSAAHQTEIENETFENLCVLYVAMTRAKRGLSVLLRPPAKTASATTFFSDIIADAIGESLPWSSGHPDAMQGAPARAPEETPAPLSFKRNKRQPAVRRVTPSSAVVFGRSASELFVPHGTTALQRGTRLHAALRRIEWLTPDAPQPEDLPVADLDLTVPSALRDALMQPPDAIDLWRERSFECVAGGVWMSGTFDRVVFSERGAEIFDFKTNRIRADESGEKFAQRMAETYEVQMADYRLALTRLTGLPESAIRCTLLLTATRETVSVC